MQSLESTNSPYCSSPQVGVPVEKCHERSSSSNTAKQICKPIHESVVKPIPSQLGVGGLRICTVYCVTITGHNLHMHRQMLDSSAAVIKFGVCMQFNQSNPATSAPVNICKLVKLSVCGPPPPDRDGREWSLSDHSRNQGSRPPSVALDYWEWSLSDHSLLHQNSCVSSCSSEML